MSEHTEAARPESPTRSNVGEDEWWDPPCRVCKVVDEEPNVLCELCNGAYHLACIENIKPPLPRTPDDDEWFCRGCVNRGVPEKILGRVGRQSSAHYLVKWLGRPLHQVSWEDAPTLDTAWSRKLVREYLLSVEPAQQAIAPVLPPCHPLVDTRRARAAASDAEAALAFASAGGAVEQPAVDSVAAGTQMLACLRVFASRVPAVHPLAPLAREATRLLRASTHPR